MAKKRKRRLKKSVKIALGVIAFLISAVVIWSIEYHLGIQAVDKNGKTIEVTIEEGDSYSSLGSFFKEQKLIRSELFYKIYVRTHHLNELVPGVYKLSQTMDVATILTTLSNQNKEFATITFREGLNIRQMASIVEEKVNVKADEFISVASNKEYLQEWINQYWFLTEDILNTEIYYPLEGYLFPDTYHIENGSSAKKIIDDMLVNTEKKLEPYKDKLENNGYSIHELITMSSILELEVAATSDRNGVVSVFYNRLESGMPLGADATTYYAEKLELHERDLYQTELDACNAYNTRCSTMVGLPVGPICNPGIESIQATLNPTASNYLYYVADNQGKTYFAATYREHNNIINDLKAKGLFERWN